MHVKEFLTWSKIGGKSRNWFNWFSDRWVWPRLGCEKTMGFILSQFWRQLQLERRKREMVRPGASAEPTSTLVYWPNSVTGPSRSKHLGAISLSRGKTRTFLQRVTLSSQPPYLLEKWNPFQIGWWVIIFHDKMIKLSSRACRIPLVSPATLVICLFTISVVASRLSSHWPKGYQAARDWAVVGE